MTPEQNFLEALALHAPLWLEDGWTLERIDAIALWSLCGRHSVGRWAMSAKAQAEVEKVRAMFRPAGG